MEPQEKADHLPAEVGTARCDVRAAFSGATSSVETRNLREPVPAAARGRGHRSAMSLPNTSPAGLSWTTVLLLSLASVASFQLAYSFPSCSFLIVVWLWSLFELTRLSSSRQASYVGLAIGMLLYAPQLGCFWTIFGPAAIALWFVLAFWIRMFLVLGRLCRLHFGSVAAALLLPCLWTGLEYFRSELYYLRFSWLNAGYVFSNQLRALPIKQLGVYGIGFVLMACISLTSLASRRARIGLVAGLLVIVAALTQVPGPKPVAPQRETGLAVAGVQMEFPSDKEVLANLDRLIEAHPEARLLVLSEYTFTGPVPERIKAWCREHQRHLIVGGEEPLPGNQFYNTAFVIGPEGEVVFTQVKSVPLPFFKDGLPAPQQRVWESPWGKIGLCICYDLSYTRVVDELVRLGAQAIIVPTMDVADWGRHQHELHSRVTPVRAAEYGIPVFRLASSGVSQCVDGVGRVLGTAPFPGEFAMLAGRLELGTAGRLPRDRVIAPVATIVTVLVTCWFLVLGIRGKLKAKPVSAS